MKRTELLNYAKNIGIVQPISHLRNFNKYILPILKTGRTIKLTKNGATCCQISLDYSNDMLDTTKYARKSAGKVVEKHLDELDTDDNYTTSQAEQMVNNHMNK